LPKTLWILTPCYFDSASYQRLHQNALAIVAEQCPDVTVRFVVVDDSAGRDEELKALKDKFDFLLLEAPFNLGHQRALVFALRSLRSSFDDADVVMTMDSDGEDSPEDIPRLLDAHKRQGAGIAFAERRKRSESFVFKALYMLFKMTFRLATGITIRTGNFLCARAGLFKNIIDHPYFDQVYSSTFHALDLQTSMVPCDRGKRYDGRSKMGLQRLLIHGISMLMPFSDRIAIRSLVLFTVSLGSAVTLGAGVLLVRLFTELAIPGWASSIILLSVTLSFVSIGNFLLLFSLFSQLKVRSLSFIDEHRRP